MNLSFTDDQIRCQEEFRRFADKHIAPGADAADREERFPLETVRQMANAGYLGSFLPHQWGGRAVDMVTYGLIHKEIGKACSSARSLITVHDMVCLAIWRWGTEEQRETWLRPMVRGDILAAFAITEPNAGCDLKGIETVVVQENGGYVLNGVKRWITFGQVADLFLVLGRLAGEPTTFLVERKAQGISVVPIVGLLGMRASMLAQVNFSNCRIPGGSILGRPAFGLTSVIYTALGLGRYSVAWGSLGIAEACLNACLSYTAQRTQFGVRLKEHQLIQGMIADMVTEVKAARLLCLSAGHFRQANDRRELGETLAAKYYASRLAMRAASDGVQIHGANGCSSEYPIQRYLRDAKVMEIIEGSNQMQQIMIANHAYQNSKLALSEARCF